MDEEKKECHGGKEMKTKGAKSGHDFGAGTCKLMAANVGQSFCSILSILNISPRNHVNASDVDGASRYRIALVSTILRATRFSQCPNIFRMSGLDAPFPWTMLVG